MLLEFTKLFAFMGKTMSSAFSDITTKAEYISRNGKLHTDVSTLNEILEKEQKIGIHTLNGNNNKKQGHGKGSEWANYISSSRTLLRNLWFLDFVEGIILNLVEDPKKSLRNCAGEAYDKSLGPHHPWIVRTGAKAGLMTVPNREKFVLKVAAEQEGALSTAELLEKIAVIPKLIKPLKDYFWDYYRENKLDTLP